MIDEEEELASLERQYELYRQEQLQMEALIFGSNQHKEEVSQNMTEKNSTSKKL